jgi:Spy/CpxP family protein refolding chaperone
MKKFLPLTLAAVTLGLAAALAPPAQAAPGAHPAQADGQRGARMQKLADYLGLSDAQKARMKPLLQSAGQQARAIQGNASLTPQAKQAKMMGLSQSMNQQMMAVLTPAQREKLKAMRQQRAAKGGKA